MADQINNGSNLIDPANAAPNAASAETGTPGAARSSADGVNVRSKLPSLDARVRVNSSSNASMEEPNGSKGRRQSAAAPSVAVPKARRMKLSLTKVDPWSVAKVSFLLSIAFGIIQIIAVSILWWLLSAVGLFDKLNTVISSTGLSSSGVDVNSFLGFGQVISWVTIFAVFEVLLIVILATVSAFLYNVVSSLVGGVHLTLGDD
ncbi:MAG: DUF3566 domain-containing protein [Bifidobacteriaceae bacterium]|jgi:hypothetical protein|nr:DUF3566 domain-containing protein [Bifidobacteriaceae bacterium]